MISQKGVDFIVKMEGVRLCPYQDSVGIWTIGVGHTGEIEIEGKKYSSVGEAVKNIKVPFAITYPYAKELFYTTLDLYTAEVLKSLNGAATTIHQLDAMVSLAYNIGPAAFRKSTLLKKHIAGDYAAAADCFISDDEKKGFIYGRRADKVPFVIKGLVRRRKAEKIVYLDAIYDF